MANSDSRFNSRCESYAIATSDPETKLSAMANSESEKTNQARELPIKYTEIEEIQATDPKIRQSFLPILSARKPVGTSSIAIKIQ